VSKHRYTSHTAKAEPSPEDEGSPEPAETKNTDAAAAPRREGLRPRQGIRPPRLELSSQDYEDDDQNSSDREMGMKGKTRFNHHETLHAQVSCYFWECSSAEMELETAAFKFIV